ncbi:hypothetical protein [Epilithonimonas sp.]|uniref:hypothetical protein n=1 Tax=Epilithonimonas sp. TaxID=2894511 RepID=UPI002899B136|nr:hypothetical protein [Epilithonimonas sp.]
MEIRLTEVALISLQEIYDFLKLKWTPKEVQIMRNDIERFIESFDLNVIKYPYYKNSQIQTTLIGKKQVTIFFRQINPQTIEVLLFHANKKNPELLKKILDL